MSNPAQRIAIKFGASSSSSSKPTNGSKRQTRAQPSSALGKRHRAQPHNQNFDSHSDSESGEEAGARHEAITTFGGESSDSDNSEAKRQRVGTDKSRRGIVPYVISGHQDRDWKKELKARTQPRGVKEARSSDLKETVPADQDSQIKWGLNNTAKKPISSDAEQFDDSHLKREKSASSESQKTSRDAGLNISQSDDNDAMDALLGKKRKSAKDLIIEAHNTPEAPSEIDVYRRRMEEAAEVSTVEEYGQIPEGEFGIAMLRGMGWNGEQRGNKPKEVKKRPNLLGLGAKVDEEIRKGELAQKHGHRERKPRLDEYRRDKEKERRDRESRHGNSYKSERERERQDRDYNTSSSRHDRDRTSHRYSDRGPRR
ncbi:DExH-box splicing factor binding site-domain-containing protein [Annulohypoxylon maeteangense]|uniref:DExH-box splicing factor binding site-domain-containing protein n=1 Tax=Annulohypoxylon maeteangense TaxID=1927788 RepID=UPI002008A578|nr:DExH-box splicing factor binding site-domain-containing protein [Annulohypoxylon maeteangense]KAI0880812.1 DExH-box splicing factor binding site-domain-containing protein [Annulohypoxylon maeteangense]